MTLSQIESAIKQLRHEEFAELSQWFEEYEAQIWDEQIGEDLKNGKLDGLIAQAETDFASGAVDEL